MELSDQVNYRSDRLEQQNNSILSEVKALRRNEPVDVDGPTTMLIARLQNNVRQSQARILKEVLLLEKRDGLSQAEALKKVYETPEAEKAAAKQIADEEAKKKKRINEEKKALAKAKRDAKKAAEDKAAEPSDGQDAAEEKPNGKQAAKKPSKKKAAGDTAAASEGSASASGPLAPFLKQRDVVA